MTRGRFISVEGGEGAGKSSNIAFLRERLEANGIPVVLTREPGGTALAEEIRALLLVPRAEPVDPDTELLLMYAARVQHCRQVIEPALARGDWVISDRFADATLAYQGYGRGADLGRIRAIQHLMLRGFTPDLTLLLDIPVEAGAARVRQRGAADRFEQEELAFFERVRRGYLELAAEEPGRFRVIDANVTLATVRERIAGVLDGFLHACAAVGGEA